jgi:hypothetical protein|tara:strand:- start:5572 stop:5676 length:105 start_codon:yes stop_codon:yes gene_type:complete
MKEFVINNDAMQDEIKFVAGRPFMLIKYGGVYCQ